MEDLSTKEIRGCDYDFLHLSSLNPPSRFSKKINCVDLFCGCGGISIGIREACYELGYDFNPVLAIDSFSPACLCYKNNFPNSHVLNCDITSILSLNHQDNTSQKDSIFYELPQVDILVGGPPCQGHSDLNNYTRRNDPKNQLYLYMLRAAEVLHPKHVLIENVLGAAHDKGHVVQIVTQKLSQLGYNISIGGVYMPDIGVPQTRKRLLVVASLTKSFDFSDISNSESYKTRDLRWAIGDLVNKKSQSLFETTAKPSIDNARRMEYLFSHDVYDLPNSERPPCHRDKAHSYNSVYGRLHWNLPAQTITSGFCNMSMGRFVHPSECRTLTPHEAARIQFFPDFFDFSSVSKRSDLTTLIGNAVPSKLPFLIGIKLFERVK